MKKIFIILLAVLIVFVHSIAFTAGEKHPKLDPDTASADVMVDIVCTRPIGFIGLIAGSILYLVTLPIAVATKSMDRTQQAFVIDPYEYTFERPLGDIRGENNY